MMHGLVSAGRETGVSGKSFAPASLTQPINPGWVFGSVHITNENSSDPAAERRITETISYGRQLGRLMDAITVLIARADPDVLSGEQKALVPEPQKAFDDFWDLLKKIQAAKSADPARWLSEQGMTELAGRLKALRTSDRDRYERLAAVLRTALES